MVLYYLLQGPPGLEGKKGERGPKGFPGDIVSPLVEGVAGNVE